MRNEHQISPYCTVDGDLPALFEQTVGIWESHCKRVKEDGCGVLEGHMMLLEIRRSFARIPLKRHASQV